MWIPELKFGFAAGFKAANFARSGMIPGQQLPGRGVVFSCVEVSKQRRRGEASGAQVEDEVHKGVELALVQRDFDQALDSRFGDGKVVAEDGFALERG